MSALAALPLTDERADDLAAEMATEAAVWRYLAAGWAVIPLHSMRAGSCTCGKPDCSSPGKHPIAQLVPDGFKSASTDPVVVQRWLDNAPWMNVGLPTGRSQGITVVDVDAGHGGMETIARLEERYGNLPETRLAETGGGGVHLVFVAPAQELKNSAGRIGRGVDVRGDGGYIVAAPSLHRSGQRYAWQDESTPILPMPAWLLARAQADPVAIRLRRTVRPFGPAPRLGDRYAGPIGDGSRNTTLTRIAGSLRRQGLDEPTIADTLLNHNARQCSPPLPEREVLQIARNAGRWPQGASA